MQMNILKFLKDSDVDEAFYPGKRLVWKCPQPGEYKSHCVVFDWRAPENVRIELKAGLSGKDLHDKELANYPVSFQAPTFVDIDILDEKDEDEEEEGGSARGKGGGSKKPKKKKKPELAGMQSAFGKVVEGQVPETGEIKQMVVMGKEIAKEAYESVLSKLSEQIKQTKVLASDLLSQAGSYITRYTPPEFLQAKGDEQAVYKYDRDKNAPMFGAAQPG